MDLGDRMKAYEGVTDITLTRRMPLILRIDGRAFHTWTRSRAQPFDSSLMQAFVQTALSVCAAMDGAIFAYGQSDEVSFLLQDWYGLDTNPWFNKRLQKVVSISASLFTAHFNQAVQDTHPPLAFFDARAFGVPLEDVNNYFLWRQRDATRNSIQALGQHYFSSRALQGLSNDAVQDKLWQECHVNWNDLPVWQKRGWALRIVEGHWQSDLTPPIFSHDLTYLTQHFNAPSTNDCTDPAPIV